jgi:hypothetical protein
LRSKESAERQHLARAKAETLGSALAPGAGMYIHLKFYKNFQFFMLIKLSKKYKLPGIQNLFKFREEMEPEGSATLLSRFRFLTNLIRPCRLLQARQFLEPWPYFLGRENQMLSWPIVESESGRILSDFHFC